MKKGLRPRFGLRIPRQSRCLNRDLMKKGLRQVTQTGSRQEDWFESRPYEEGIKTVRFPGARTLPAFESRPYEEGIKTPSPVRFPGARTV